ncbi:hypothetical protein STEG23_006451, partial [Scotinomys teguina]
MRLRCHSGTCASETQETRLALEEAAQASPFFPSLVHEKPGDSGAYRGKVHEKPWGSGVYCGKVHEKPGGSGAYRGKVHEKPWGSGVYRGKVHEKPGGSGVYRGKVHEKPGGSGAYRVLPLASHHSHKSIAHKDGGGEQAKNSRRQ